MPYEHLATLSGALVKRAAGDGSGLGHGHGEMAQLPGWAVLVFFADFLVFAPIFLYIAYTLSHIYPTLAIIESPDSQPPTYASLSLNPRDPSAAAAAADDEDEDVDPADLAAAAAKVDGPPALTTTSLRSIDLLLRQTGGWTANFRGLGCALVLQVAAGLCGFLSSLVVPRFVGVLVATLATVQLSTAWTHIIISAPSPEPFWRRLPPFAKTFRATWLPITAYWAAVQVTRLLPRLLAAAFGLVRWDPRNPTAVPNYTVHAVWQSFAVLLVTIACGVLLVMPAQVILCRVQASLLPPDEDTIIPFDRSFGGAVEPAVVTGKGYVDFRTAFRTFDRDSWIRLYKLLAKIMLVAWGVYALVMAIVVPEAVLMLRTAQTPEGN